MIWGCVPVVPGLVHVGDELREVNGNLITHKRPDEISQILVKEAKASQLFICFSMEYMITTALIPAVFL